MNDVVGQCPHCERGIEPNTPHGGCRVTGLCHRCCVETGEACWDGCGQVLSEYADDNSAEFAA